jgi:alkyl hydroperoxide reductase subunit AhpF
MMWTSAVENYPGFNLVQARELVEKFRAQVRQYPIDVASGLRVASIAKDSSGFLMTGPGGEAFAARALILATGKRYRSLNVPGEKELIGKGVAYCATCDAPLFAGKPVAVVGGGNSALTSANELLHYASRISLVNLSDAIQGDRALLEPLERSGKVDFLMRSKVSEIHGRDRVEGLTVDSPGGVVRLEVSGVFVEIGLIPNSDLAKGLADMNDDGEVVVDCSCRTSLPGLFSAGDVTTVPAKQIVVAAGEGAKAALAAYDWLLAHPG